MLGSVKQKQGWAWGAAGKHPVARDYIAIGAQTPLLKAFADWMESGYSALQERPQQACSWRFWARGMKKQELVCGLLRDSNDSVGRPYPFLIFGTGPLDGWEETWELLPYVFEGIWSRMEYVGSKKSFDVSALESDLGMLPYPTLFQGAGAAAGKYQDMHELDSLSECCRALPAHQGRAQRGPVGYARPVAHPAEGAHRRIPEYGVHGRHTGKYPFRPVQEVARFSGFHPVVDFFVK